MVARLKDKGIREVETLRKRVVQLSALKRISNNDASRLVEMLNGVEAYIIKMDEKPNNNERRML